MSDAKSILDLITETLDTMDRNYRNSQETTAFVMSERDFEFAKKNNLIKYENGKPFARNPNFPYDLLPVSVIERVILSQVDVVKVQNKLNEPYFRNRRFWYVQD
jgi:hypothetical protein